MVPRFFVTSFPKQSPPIRSPLRIATLRNDSRFVAPKDQRRCHGSSEIGGGSVWKPPRLAAGLVGGWVGLPPTKKHGKNGWGNFPNGAGFGFGNICTSFQNMNHGLRLFRFVLGGMIWIWEMKRSEEYLKRKGEILRAVPLCRSLFASPSDFFPWN